MPYDPLRPGQEKKPAGKKATERRFTRAAVLFVCLLLVLYGTVRLVVYTGDLLASRRTSRDLKETLAASEPPAPASESTVLPSAVPEKTVPAEIKGPDAGTVSPSSPPLPEQEGKKLLPPVAYPNGLRVNPRVRKLREKSEYIIGWLTMDDLEEPVAMKDNTFFLDHDALGMRNSNGAIFLDQDTDLMTRPYTILLYGHNMKSGAMFGNLRKYADPVYCGNHRILRLDTLYDEGSYAVFAAAAITLTPGTGRFFDLDSLQSADPDLRQAALDTLSVLSSSGVVLDVRPEDPLLLLVTCTGGDDERFIVAARRLREGESADRLTLKAK